MNQNKLIIIYGPTGVGKTEYALSLGQSLNIEIINGDVGQFYEPLAIGTAKPDWKKEPIPHHLFDVLQNPEDCTVVKYRALVLEKVKEVWSRGAVPVIVGGSGFYIKSLFFAPKGDASRSFDTTLTEFAPLRMTRSVECREVQCINPNHPECFLSGNEKNVSKDEETEKLWQKLKKRDPKRAEEIYQQDRYRIERALALLNKGTTPSECVPEYQPLEAEVLLCFLNRPRPELYDRINQRTQIMFDQGWLAEVEPLMNTPWQEFLVRKKLIGYNDIITFLEGDRADQEKELLYTSIQKKTRNYAKRQLTFWRMLEKLMNEHFKKPSKAIEVDVAHVSPEQFKESVERFIKG